MLFFTANIILLTLHDLSEIKSKKTESFSVHPKGVVRRLKEQIVQDKIF